MMIQTNQEILLLNLQMNPSTNFPGKKGKIEKTTKSKKLMEIMEN